MAKGDALYGDGINVAARLEGLAESGGICISGAAFEQIKHKRCGYVLPLNYQRLINRSRILDKFSKRWLTFSSALNILVLQKNAVPLTPVKNSWTRSRILPPKVVRPTLGRGMKYDK